MPQNLPEQILQRNVKLSADSNSQREVARMLGLSQGCISKILRRNRETGRPHQRKRVGSMKISTPREDRQRRPLLEDGYWSRRPASCPRLTLEHRRRRREWERRHRVWDLRQWRHCIFGNKSRFSLYHSDGRVRVRRRQGERLIDACVQPNDGNRGPSVMV